MQLQDGKCGIVDVKKKSFTESRKDTASFCMVHIDEQLHFIQHWSWDYDVNHKFELIGNINFQEKLPGGLVTQLQKLQVFILQAKK